MDLERHKEWLWEAHHAVLRRADLLDRRKALDAEEEGVEGGEEGVEGGEEGVEGGPDGDGLGPWGLPRPGSFGGFEEESNGDGWDDKPSSAV